MQGLDFSTLAGFCCSIRFEFLRRKSGQTGQRRTVAVFDEF